MQTQLGQFISQGKGRAPTRLFFDENLFSQLESSVFDQAENTANTPGVETVCILPDAHSGYGAPIGSVVITKNTILPGPVGFDIGCGMLVLLTNLTRSDLQDRPIRRAVMNAITSKVAMGKGNNSTFNISVEVMLDVLNSGSNALVKYGFIPRNWIERCENPDHRAKRSNRFYLEDAPEKARRGYGQLGTLGGGNHFCELQYVELPDDDDTRVLAEKWGLKNDQIVVMLHSGSRGFGHGIGEWAFKAFREKLDTERELLLQKINKTQKEEGRARNQQEENAIASVSYLDRELVFSDDRSEVGIRYLNLLEVAANFACCNRLLMASAVSSAIKEVFPSASTDLLYDISHNLVQLEKPSHTMDDWAWVHRKGTTRAFPAGHPSLCNTPWSDTGHPVITPGSMGTFSAIQVGLPGAESSFFSINHGAGRRLGRKKAKDTLNQAEINKQMSDQDILVNTRDVPLDEAAPAYKDLTEVLQAVAFCGLAKVVAKCHPIASMKGND